MTDNETLATCEHGHAICSICNASIDVDLPLPWDLIVDARAIAPTPGAIAPDERLRASMARTEWILARDQRHLDKLVAPSVQATKPQRPLGKVLPLRPDYA